MYLNRDVTASSSEARPFSLKPILLELEGGRYMGLILTVPLAELVSGRRGGGDIIISRGGGVMGGSNRGGRKLY